MLSINQSTNLSIYLPTLICLSVCLSVYLSIYLSISINIFSLFLFLTGCYIISDSPIASCLSCNPPPFFFPTWINLLKLVNSFQFWYVAISRWKCGQWVVGSGASRPGRDDQLEVQIPIVNPAHLHTCTRSRPIRRPSIKGIGTEWRFT